MWACPRMAGACTCRCVCRCGCVSGRQLSASLSFPLWGKGGLGSSPPNVQGPIPLCQHLSRDAQLQPTPLARPLPILHPRLAHSQSLSTSPTFPAGGPSASAIPQPLCLPPDSDAASEALAEMSQAWYGQVPLSPLGTKL